MDNREKGHTEADVVEIEDDEVSGITQNKKDSPSTTAVDKSCSSGTTQDTDDTSMNGGTEEQEQESGSSASTASAAGQGSQSAAMGA